MITTGLNLAEGLPDGLPRFKDHVPLEPFALRPMARLAIYMRSLRPDELQATVQGRELYDDTHSLTACNHGKPRLRPIACVATPCSKR